MTLVYQFITLSLSIILYPWLKINKKTALFLSQRYGQNPVPAGDYYWFHGASLGEIQGLLPLINQLRVEKPKAQILGTATSVKGYQQMEKITDFASLLPIDHPIYIQKFLAHAKIQRFIFGETEIWPCLINFLSRKKINCYMVNARLSEFNFKKYLFLKKFFQNSLGQITDIFCISEENRNRFIQLGANPLRIQITGNLKYDQGGDLIEPEVSKISQAKFFSSKLPVFAIASIRPGEEEYFSNVLIACKDKFNIIIAPRHVEKFTYFKNYLTNLGLPFQLKSKLNKPYDGSLLLLDSIGELREVYSFSQICFIGGSLVPKIGGHNPMEAAPYKNILMIGPEHQNQIDCVVELQKNQGIIVVRSAQDILEVLNNYSNFLSYGERAKMTWLDFQNKSKLVFRNIFSDA